MADTSTYEPLGRTTTRQTQREFERRRESDNYSTAIWIFLAVVFILIVLVGSAVIIHHNDVRKLKKGDHVFNRLQADVLLSNRFKVFNTPYTENKRDLNLTDVYNGIVYNFDPDMDFADIYLPCAREFRRDKGIEPLGLYEQFHMTLINGRQQMGGTIAVHKCDEDTDNQALILFTPTTLGPHPEKSYLVLRFTILPFFTATEGFSDDWSQVLVQEVHNSAP